MKIYLDRMIFEFLRADASARQCLVDAHNSGRLHVCLSPVNLDEFYGRADTPPSKRIADETLELAADLSVPPFLKATGELLTECAELALGARTKVNPFYSRINETHHVLHALDWMHRREATHTASSVDALRAKRDQARTLFLTMRTELMERTRMIDRSEGNNATFREFSSIIAETRLNIYGIARPLYTESLRRKAAAARIAGLELMVDAIAYRFWAILVRQTSRRVSLKGVGHEDHRQVIYAAFVDAFVTEDENFRNLLRTIHPEPSRIWTYGDLIQQASGSQSGRFADS